ncbi:WXG100 family type VII secretion target [Streptomyces sp. NPDC006476]|uniref:WXG100 family type VII secretion target n=1 Tax=Streptomyces sp. NPDC006476 TaxID=3157175 RepID=UPI0033B2BF75
MAGGSGPLSTTVDLAGMSRAYSAFQDRVAHCTRSGSNMEQQHAMLGIVWEGPASKTFCSALQEWLTNFQTVTNELNKMAGVLEQNTATYRSTHQSTIDEASQVKSAVAQSLPGFGH